MQQINSSSACFSYNFADFLLDELWVAYQMTRAENQRTIDQHNFEDNAIKNLISLRDDIIQKNYRPNQDPLACPVYDHIAQKIIASPFRDRIVHHFLTNISATWWDQHFSPDSYSCHKGKGTLYSQKRLLRHLCQVTENYTLPAFAIKLNIRDFFDSIDRKKLLRRTLWGLEKQFFQTNLPDPINNIRCQPQDKIRLYLILKRLWELAVIDQPKPKSTDRYQSKSQNKLSLQQESQSKKYGIAAKNATSQLLSNIFLDQLDHFITTELGYKHYGRHIDIFFILVPISKKQQLLSDMEVIHNYLHDKLSLTLQSQNFYQHGDQKNLPHISTTIHPHLIMPAHCPYRNYYRTAYRFSTKSIGSIENMITCLSSNQHVDTRRFFHHLFNVFGWEY